MGQGGSRSFFRSSVPFDDESFVSVTLSSSVLVFPLSVSQNPGISCSLCSPSVCKSRPDGEEDALLDYDQLLSAELPQYWWPAIADRES